MGRDPCRTTCYFLTIAEAARRLKSKTLSPVEFTEAILARIGRNRPRSSTAISW